MSNNKTKTKAKKRKRKFGRAFLSPAVSILEQCYICLLLLSLSLSKFSALNFYFITSSSTLGDALQSRCVLQRFRSWARNPHSINEVDLVNRGEKVLLAEDDAGGRDFSPMATASARFSAFGVCGDHYDERPPFSHFDKLERSSFPFSPSVEVCRIASAPSTTRPKVFLRVFFRSIQWLFCACRRSFARREVIDLVVVYFLFSEVMLSCGLFAYLVQQLLTTQKAS